MEIVVPFTLRPMTKAVCVRDREIKGNFDSLKAAVALFLSHPSQCRIEESIVSITTIIRLIIVDIFRPPTRPAGPYLRSSSLARRELDCLRHSETPSAPPATNQADHRASVAGPAATLDPDSSGPGRGNLHQQPAAAWICIGVQLLLHACALGTFPSNNKRAVPTPKASTGTVSLAFTASATHCTPTSPAQPLERRIQKSVQC